MFSGWACGHIGGRYMHGSGTNTTIRYLRILCVYSLSSSLYSRDTANAILLTSTFVHFRSNSMSILAVAVSSEARVDFERSGLAVFGQVVANVEEQGSSTTGTRTLIWSSCSRSMINLRSPTSPLPRFRRFDGCSVTYSEERHEPEKIHFQGDRCRPQRDQ